MYAIVFILLGVIIGLIYNDLKDEDARATLVFNDLISIRAKQTALENKLVEANKKIATANEKFESVYNLAQQLVLDCNEYDKKLVFLEPLCEKLRKRIITLQDKISQKSINVQLIEDKKGQGVRSLIKEH